MNNGNNEDICKGIIPIRSSNPLGKGNFVISQSFDDLCSWSNEACLGYVVWAMKKSDFKKEAINEVIAELKTLLDEKTIDEAIEFYEKSNC